MNVRPDVLVAVATACCLGGIMLVVAAVRGTSAPPGPPSRFGAAARRLWRGSSRSVADRRARQVLLLSGLAVAVVMYLVLRLPAAAVLSGLAVPGVPWLFSLGRAEQRAIARLEAIGEWIQRLNDRLATGQGLQAAIVSSVNAAPASIAPEVQLLAEDLTAGVVTAEVALRRFADKADDVVADEVVAALLLHLTDRGERLSAVLSALAESTARSVLSRKEISAKRSEPRNTVVFMAMFGLVVFVAVLVNSDMADAYRTPLGQVVMAVVVAAYVGLLVWTRRMNAPKRRPRILAPVELRGERS